MADTSAAESAEIQLKPGLAECMECGAVVKDYDKHAKWHTALLGKLFAPSIQPVTSPCPTCRAQVVVHEIYLHQQWHNNHPHR